MVDAILSSDGEGKMIYRFPVDDAQMLIDVIDEVRSTICCHGISACPNLIAASGRVGSAWARSVARDTESMPRIAVQDVWPPCTSSDSPQDPNLLRSNRRRDV